MKKDIILEDTTLRDGEQAPGVSFSKATKIAIHDLLVDAGVRWIEAGIPAMGGDELEALKFLLARGSDATLVAWNRGVRKDIELSLALGFRAVHIGLPSSDVLLRYSVGRDRSWLLQQARELIMLAKDRGAFVSVSAEDVGRVDPVFLAEYAGTVQESGADRLRLSDTIGIMTPESYAECIGRLTKICSIDIQCHTHNDFGLGLANTLAGLHAGARYFHVTVNGIGERAGLPDLAQTAMALKHLYGVDLGIIGSNLPKLSQYVSEASQCQIPPWQPIVGRNIFAHESGIHVNAMLKNPMAFEPMMPEEAGATRQFVLGKHSGRALVRAILEKEGVQANEDELAACLERARSLAIEQGHAVEPKQLLDIYSQVSALHGTSR